MKGDAIVHVILFFFIGALLVLVVTHAAGFATATTAVGGQVANMGSLLAGSGATTGYTLTNSGNGKSSVTFGSAKAA